MTIGVISVSPRRESNSIKVANFLEKNLEERDQRVELYSFVNFDARSIRENYIQPDEATAEQQELLDLIERSDKVVWVVPEYNRLAPSEFVSFITHFGSKKFPVVWNDVSHAVVGVSSGLGGRDALQYVQKVFTYMINAVRGNAVMLPYSFQSANTGEQFDDRGEFIGTGDYQEGVNRFLDLLVGDEG